MSNHSALPSSALAELAFDALGDPMRRQMLRVLRDGARPVGQLADELPIGRPAVSKHLRVLEGAGLVEHRSVGTRTLYALAPGGLAVVQQWLVNTWDTALASFARFVDAQNEAATGAATSPPNTDCHPNESETGDQP